MKRILLTGFDPFGGEKINPSWEIAKSLDGMKIGKSAQIISRQLPCEFGTSLHLLEAALRELQPSMVICLGQAGGRAEMSLERIAINLDDARIPDNAGAQPIDNTIIPDAPAAYFSTLPIKAMMQSLQKQGIPAAISQTAGTYVCNHVFFGLMHVATTHQCIEKAGFVHIPYLPSQAIKFPQAPSMSFDVMRAGVVCMIDTALNRKEDVKLAAGANH
ncbi:MAG: pyroglutamyl-peptidase I [Burkholderiaceae bacterium]|nr:pyroglutamyl-peptidase I [Burkholderiaceae bacterium]